MFDGKDERLSADRPRTNGGGRAGGGAAAAASTSTSAAVAAARGAWIATALAAVAASAELRELPDGAAPLALALA